MKFLSIALMLLLGLLHVYASNLEQKNREEIFMAVPDFEQHQQFIQNLPAGDPILVAGRSDEISLFEKRLRKNFSPSLTITNPQALKQDRYDSQALISLIDNEGHSALILTPNQELSSDNKQQIFDQIITMAKTEFPHLSFAGVGYINHELDQSSRIIQTFLFPFTFFLCFIGLLLILKSLRLSALIFFPSVLTTGLSLALIKLALNHLDMVTSIIPLMTFVLNLTMGLHIALTRLHSKDMKDVIIKKMRPILLMVTTTAVGFGSLMTSDIPVIRSFAWLSCVLILSTHLVHILIVYPFYDLLYPQNYRLPNFILALTKWFQLEQIPFKRIFVVLGLLFLIGLYAGSTIPIHTQAAHYFDPKGPITRGQEFIHQHFLGNPNLEILIKIDDYDFAAAQKLALLEAKLARQTGEKIISATSLTIEANRRYSGMTQLPANHFSWAALLGQVPLEFKESLLSDEYYKITLLGPLKENDHYFNLISKVHSILKESELPFEFGGLYYTLMLSQQNLIRTLAYSFSLSLLIMIFLAYIFYPKTKILLCFSLVNLIPLGLSLIGFKILGLSFNVATVMTFSLSLGMIVDGTFHIIHAAVSGDSYEEALSSTFGPIFISSSLLAFCFLTFAPMDFLPIREFGLALALNCLIGLYFDLAILPRLLSSLKISEKWKLGERA